MSATLFQLRCLRTCGALIQKLIVQKGIFLLLAVDRETSVLCEGRLSVGRLEVHSQHVLGRRRQKMKRLVAKPEFVVSIAKAVLVHSPRLREFNEPVESALNYLGEIRAALDYLGEI